MGAVFQRSSCVVSALLHRHPGAAYRSYTDWIIVVSPLLHKRLQVTFSRGKLSYDKL